MEGRDQDLFPLIEPHVRSQGAELVEVRVSPGARGKTVLVVIHSSQGITLGDCTRVTRSLGAALDASEALDGRYVLEVSSPGANRVLQDPREFDVFRGVRVRLFLAEESQERELTGVLAGNRGEAVVVCQEDDRESVVPWSRIAKARLVPEELGRASAGGKER